MRWLLRMLIFWVIAAPLFYVFGLPKLLEHLNTKTRTSAFEQCIAHLKNENMLGEGAGKITPARGDQYCHCVSDGLTITQADLIEMVKQKPPAGITALSQSLAQSCNDTLSRDMNAEAARAGTPATPSPIQDLTIIETPN